ncbi:hypothetical protein BDP55DRAFT_183715 [Colletotrichum godetiae]|uniref:Uncharacterized protein n=1 Tax=Colletotrichum godetiae TaxID=1209918 RepID=A0AAJ0AMD4_9PEZI|nr:uncharacterized protein BDP55DRAFT_183715 [Colletotrichum godetiae]KAK1674371.1 hypothetical protein BDP55DRAFT_183715 [Colletotrichum godetiae]
MCRCIPPSRGPNQLGIVSGSATHHFFARVTANQNTETPHGPNCGWLPVVSASEHHVGQRNRSTSHIMHVEASIEALEFISCRAPATISPGTVTDFPQWLRLQPPAGLHFPDKRHMRRLIECRCRVLSALETSENRVVEPTRLSLMIAVAYTMHGGQYVTSILPGSQSLIPQSAHELLLKEGVECPCMFSKDERRPCQGLSNGDDTAKGLDAPPRLATHRVSGTFEVGVTARSLGRSKPGWVRYGKGV